MTKSKQDAATEKERVRCMKWICKLEAALRSI